MRAERIVHDKGRAIGRAVRIVDEGLRAGLDLQDGGDAGRATCTTSTATSAVRLTQANLHNDEAALDECRGLIAAAARRLARDRAARRQQAAH